MEKIKATAFGPMPTSTPHILAVGGTNIAVYPTIPYEQVLAAIQEGVSLILTDNSFISAPIKRIITNLLYAKYYTNIDVHILADVAAEDFAVADLYSYYDILAAHDVFNLVLPLIAEQQRTFFADTLSETLNSIVAYSNSAAGILEKLTAAAENNSTKLQAALDMFQDEENFTHVKKILELLPPKK